jgi:putative hydrolase of the HAD superfamily
VEGLLLDYGGVLTTSVAESFGAFCRVEGITIDVFRDVFLSVVREPDSIFARLETGVMDQDDFDVAFARLLGDACGVPIAAQGLKQRLFAEVRPDDSMLDTVRAARAAGIRTALVSNSWGGHDYPPEIIDGGLFDATLISGHIGLRKPDAAIYLLAAERLDVKPRDCVFVDDLKQNVEGAEAVGMTGIMHRETAGTIRTLEQIFGMRLGADSRAGGE